MIWLAYHPKDQLTATQIVDGLRERGHEVAEGPVPGQENVLIALWSPSAGGDKTVLAAAENALDEGQHVVPVLLADIPLPKLLDHLASVDFSGGVQIDALEARLASLSAPEVARPLRVRTAKVKSANRRTGLIVAGIALVIFLISIWAIGTGRVGMPREEYEEIDREAAATRDALIAPTMEYLSTALPRSTEQAAEFQTTLRAVPTLVRPFLALTATAIDEQLDRFALPTPAATETPASP